MASSVSGQLSQATANLLSLPVYFWGQGDGGIDTLEVFLCLPFGGWLVGPILSFTPHEAGRQSDLLRSWAEHLQLKPRRWRVAVCGSGSGGVSTFGHPDMRVAGDGISIGAAAALWWWFAEIPAQLTPETCASPVGTVTKA